MNVMAAMAQSLTAASGGVLPPATACAKYLPQARTMTALLDGIMKKAYDHEKRKLRRLPNTTEAGFFFLNVYASLR